MRLELGINTCFAVKRWPRPIDWAPLVRDRFGLRIVQHSFDLVEATSREEFEEQAADLAGVAAAAGLRLHSTFTGLAAYSSNLLLHPDAGARARAQTWFGHAIAFTAAIGAAGTGGHVGAFSVHDWEDPERRSRAWAGLQDSLARLGSEASRAGLAYLLVENLAAAREPSTMTMFHELLTDGSSERVPIRICLDVGHMCAPGSAGEDRDPYAWLRRLGAYAPVVQLQQSDAEGDHHWPFTAGRNRQGRIDADRVIDALGEGDVQDTTLIIEVIPAFEQDDGGVVDDLVASVDYWADALTRRGVAAA